LPQGADNLPGSMNEKDGMPVVVRQYCRGNQKFDRSNSVSIKPTGVDQAQSNPIKPRKFFLQKTVRPNERNLLVAQSFPAVRFAVAFSPPAGGFFVLTKSNNRENL
jgi:hypothetical protein